MVSKCVRSICLVSYRSHTVLGYLDDLIILPMLVALTIKFIPTDVFDEYRKRARDMWQDEKPKKWYYSVPILLLWALNIVPIAKALA